MFIPDNQQMVASYAETDRVCSLLLHVLGEEETPVGYAMLGGALLIARLANEDRPLSYDEEIQFIQDLTEWARCYWGADRKARLN